MSDHNNIYSIVERLRVLEEGLDKNQRSVNQLSATFKPKTVAVLTAKQDPKNPMAGKLVGSSESVEKDKALQETDMSEDVLDQVKKSFTDFIKSVEDKIEDSDIKEKKHEDSDLKKKEKKHHDLVDKKNSVSEDPTQFEPSSGNETGETYPVTPESKAIKTVAVGNDMICEIHGNEQDGFEIRRGQRSLPTRFKDLTQAEMALEMYMTRIKKQDESQDYLDEQ
jgi:Mg2+ and Co2+ transporter CorA